MAAVLDDTACAYIQRLLDANSVLALPFLNRSVSFGVNLMPSIQRITPCLWFDHQAEQAANLYISLFSNSKITKISRYGEVGQEIHKMKPGTVMTVAFELDGQTVTALNGGPLFKFNEAVSLMINCDSQQEIDHFWTALSADGDPKAQQCGWLKDKFGLSWQVVPRMLPELLNDPDTQKSARAMKALLSMKKLDIAALKRAAAG
jgi:predicted 3-demethylubiquinone-9 3-methyltransferase (glyoxalase superfamily)